MNKKPLKNKEVTYKGQLLKLFNARQAALVANKSRRTLGRWRKEGIIPAPFFWQTIPCNLKVIGKETVRKEYLTQHELNVLVYLLDKYDVYGTKAVPAAFTDELKTEWATIHQRYETGVSAVGPAKFLWRFSTREEAVAVIKRALGLPTAAKAAQYVDAIHKTYDEFLGKGV